MNDYRGFEFKEVPDGFMLYLDNRPWQRFDNIDHMNGFVDAIHAALEVPLKPFHLHMTGCKRCQRTMSGVKHDPCKLGIRLIIDSKSLTLQVCEIFAKGRNPIPVPQ